MEVLPETPALGDAAEEDGCGPLPQALTDLRLSAQLLAEAAELERIAVRLDRRSATSEAAGAYGRAASQMSAVAAMCPAWHVDKAAIALHAEELEARGSYLASASASRHQGQPLLPVEGALSLRQLTLSPTQGAVGSKVLGMAAAFGVTAGLALRGPLAAIILSIGAVHVVGRDDSAGHLGRRAAVTSSQALALASRRASTKLRRFDARPQLYRLGEIVFVVRSMLGNVAGVLRRR
mmetsp:Transcript_40508/g.114555  ORF Transcript_40508/g.114555 Transcript_40508/m.114555 type:complete len:236 (-) Transcript_40508:157-864(-)